MLKSLGAALALLLAAVYTSSAPAATPAQLKEKLRLNSSVYRTFIVAV